MIANLQSPENLHLLFPFHSEKEIKDYKLLLGEKGSKKKKIALEKFRADSSDLGKHGLILWSTTMLQRLRALSNHATALKIMKELDLEKDYIPVITSHASWGDVLQKAIPNLTVEEVVLPVPECFLKFKYIDGKYYVIYLKQETGDIALSYKPVEVYDDPVFRNSHYGVMTDAMFPFVLYLLLSFELNLTNVVSDSGKVISFSEGFENQMPVTSIEYRLLPVSKQRGSSSESTGIGSKKKFHIRRAHWRTYENGNRVRIGWMFVGDINLGFVDKDYMV